MEDDIPKKEAGRKSEGSKSNASPNATIAAEGATSPKAKRRKVNHGE